MVTAGVLAQRGLMPIAMVIACAVFGSFTVDQFWFYMARHVREQAWVHKFRSRPLYIRAIGLLERHQTGFILAFRFIYGMRTVSPVAIGTAEVGWRKFLALNLISAAVWGCAFALLGFELGHAAFPLIKRIGPVALMIAALLVTATAIHVIRTRSRSKRVIP